MTPAYRFLDRRRQLLGGLAAALWLPARAASTLRVGRSQPLKTLASAAAVAQDGAVIEVEAGDYVGDVAVWPQHDLRLRAIDGRVRLIADGRSAQGKGIFVTTGERQRIEGFDFIGCRVPDRNGAGIRLERGSLQLRDCSFRDNENGVLTGNEPGTRLEIEDCEFGAIVRHDGQNHNLYVGAIAYLKVTGSYFHHGQLGHLLKSRAAVNHIFYNRLTDEAGGAASYELEFPNGGIALVVGNLIQQSATTDNKHMISFGAEGYRGPRQALYLVNNTLIDRLPGGGVYLRVAPGATQLRVINNLLSGNSRFASASDWDSRSNFVVDTAAFADAARGDYLLRPDSPLRGRAVDPGSAEGIGLRPTSQYLRPRGTVALNGMARDPGAVQRL